MSTPVPLPALGESVTEGTISRWLKQVGDSVDADEPLVEVSTDKVDTEVPSPVAGVLLEIKVQEDETAEVGATLALIGDQSEAEGSADDRPSEEAEEEAADAPAEEKPTEETPAQEEATPEPKEDAEPASDEGEEKKPATRHGEAQGVEVTLPALGESVTEGTISRWLKQVGDTVEADEPLVEVSTDKVDTEVPSPASGTLLEIRVQEDEVAEVGGVLAIVGEPGQEAAAEEEPPLAKEEEPSTEKEPSEAESEAAPEAPAEEKEDEVAPAEEAAETPAEEAPVEEPKAQPKAEEAEAAPRRAADEQGDADEVYVTPLVRKMAADRGVDLAQVTGTGVGGRIRKQDIIEAAEKAAAEAEKAAAKKEAEKPAPAGEPPAETKTAPATVKKDAQPTAEAAAKRGTTEKMTRLRATIAKRMVESLQVAAQLTATVEVDLTAISQLRAKAKDDFKKREGASLSYLPFICQAAIEGLKQFPKLNATIDTSAGTITYADAEHLGIAVDTPKGLLVPVIRDAGDLNVGGIAKRIADLASRTRNNKVGPDELSGGTFTVTNYGSAGTLMDTPIINQPQVAILGTGALVKRPVVISDPSLGDVIVVRDMMYLSLTYDHRLVDGAEAARFLSFVKARLEEGDFGHEFGL